MSDQTLDLRRSWQIVRRHKIVVAVFAALGLAGGIAFTLLSPGMMTSNALVLLPQSVHSVATQVVIADSDPVMAAALPRVDLHMSVQALRSRVQVKSLTPQIISISAQGKTAGQVEDTANAVAHSYIVYVGNAKRGSQPVQALLLESATGATGKPLPNQLLTTGGLGVLIGVLIGAITVLAFNRGDRRLRERDQIANALGVPVLASIPVEHPSDARQWSRLLEDYEPSVVHAWQLRTALSYLGQAEIASPTSSNGDGLSIAVLSLSSDRGALALGPQLAVFAASLGIPTALVIGPQQDPNAAAVLRAVCSAPPSSPRRSRPLRLVVADHGDVARLHGVRLSITVAVVDARAPSVAETMHAKVTVLGVSAGAVTATQLVSVAVSAATDGRQIDGILVADPDPADVTTGRVPQLTRPARRRMPTRLTGTATETTR